MKKAIVYFHAAGDLGAGLAIALHIWEKYPYKIGNEILVQGVLNHYDGFRLPCIVYPGAKNRLTSIAKSDRLFLELTCDYMEEGLFSLEIVAKSKWFCRKKSIKNLAAAVDAMLRTGSQFYGIEWKDLNQLE